MKNERLKQQLLQKIKTVDLQIDLLNKLKEKLLGKLDDLSADQQVSHNNCVNIPIQNQATKFTKEEKILVHLKKSSGQKNADFLT